MTNDVLSIIYDDLDDMIFACYYEFGDSYALYEKWRFFIVVWV